MGSLTFDPNPPSNDVVDQAAPEADDKQAELIRWYYHLGHLSLDRLLLLAKLGEIPKYLTEIKPPTYLFWAMTKKPWQTKLSQSEGRHILKAMKPGECVSIDQMVSTQVGFIAQLKEKLTKMRSHDGYILRGNNSHGQESLWTFHWKSQYAYSTLPLWQQQLCWQCHWNWLRIKQATHHLLWSKCSIPEWHY